MRGRKPLQPHARRTARVSLNFTREEADTLEAFARGEGRSFNSWARTTLLEIARGQRLPSEQRLYNMVKAAIRDGKR